MNRGRFLLAVLFLLVASLGIQPAFAGSEDPNLLSEHGTLKPSETKIYRVYIQSAGAAHFSFFKKDKGPVLYLKSPSGQGYAPQHAAYFSEEEMGISGYHLASAEVGEWQVILSGGSTGGNYGVMAAGPAEQQVFFKDDQYDYVPGEAITVKVGYFKNDQSPITGATGELQLEQEDISETIPLFDDGAHGDEQANDGIYGNRYKGFSKPGFVRLSARLQKGRVQNIGLSSLTVIDKFASFGTISSEEAIDEDGDGVYDFLKIKVGLNIRQSKPLMIEGMLKDSKDKFVDGVHWQSDTHNILGVGQQEVILKVPGETLRKEGGGGPYRLDLILRDVNRSDIIDSRENALTTKAYSVSDFTVPVDVKLVGDFSEPAPEKDANGKLLSLDIMMQVEVRYEGEYVVSMPFNDTSISASARKYMKPGVVNQVIVHVPGHALRKEMDGPYMIGYMMIYMDTPDHRNIVHGETFKYPYTTRAYKASDFSTVNYYTLHKAQ